MVKKLSSDIFTYEYFLKFDVCRLCLSQNAKTDLTNYDKYDEITEKVFYCLEITLTKECTLRRICDKCMKYIEKFYSYKVLCKEADEKFKQIISEQETIKPEKNDDLAFDLPSENEFDIFLDTLYNSESNDCQPLSEIRDKKKEFTKKSKLKKKESPTYCKVCRIDLDTAQNLDEHKKKFHGIEGSMFKCFGCEKKFKSARTRLDHELQFCKKMKNGYECHMCKRYLPIRRTYEAHMRAHRQNLAIDLPDKLFKCRICEESFKTRANLQEHINEHKDKPNYVCEVCGRVFTRRDYLHKHTLTHTGIRRHACPHCDFKATQRSTLTIHIRKHTGERPFSCEVCGLRCVSSSNLQAHRRRHAGLKRYQCTVCLKKFGYKLSLEEHVASTHESVKSHTCTVCGAAYSRIRGLKRHVKAKHNPSSQKDQPIDVPEQNIQAYLKVVSKENRMDSEVGNETAQNQVMLCD